MSDYAFVQCGKCGEVVSTDNPRVPAVPVEALEGLMSVIRGLAKRGLHSAEREAYADCEWRIQRLIDQSRGGSK